MFKSKLIENQEYYKHRVRALLFFSISSITVSFVANAFTLPLWLIITSIAALLLITYYSARSFKLLHLLSGRRSIEMNQSHIRIKSRISEELIPLEEVDEIWAKKKYVIPQESFLDLFRELRGSPLKNFIIILRGSDEMRLDFDLQSHYMITQLEEVLNSWQVSGSKVKRLEEGSQI